MIKILRSAYNLSPAGFRVVVSLTVIEHFLEIMGIAMIIPVFANILNEHGGNSFLTSLYTWVSPAFLPSTEILLLILCLVFLLKACVSYLVKKSAVRWSARIDADLKKKIVERVLSLELKAIKKAKKGSFVNVLVTDTMRASSAILALTSWITGVFSLVFYITLATVLSWNLFLVAVLVGMIGAGVFRFVTRKTEIYGERVREVNEQLNYEAYEIVECTRLIKSTAREQAANQGFSESIDRYQHSLFFINLFAGLPPIVAQPIAVCTLSVILWLGIKFNMANSSLFAFLVALYRIIPSYSLVQTTSINLGSLYPSMQIILDFFKNTQDLVEKFPAGKKVDLTDQITLEQVSFSYDDGSSRVLKNISVAAKAGAVISVVGKSGGGKTTLMDLLLGFFSPDTGRILIDGHNLKDIDLRHWRSQIAYVSQETLLMHKSVRYNLTWDNKDISDEEIVKTLKDFQAIEFVRELPQGLDEVIGDQGSRLSGGQRQRLALARAILSGPRVLILDEATSALDYHNEKLITTALEKICRERKITVIKIAHRLETVKDSDWIWVIENGEIVEQGTWDRVCGSDQWYLASHNQAVNQVPG